MSRASSRREWLAGVLAALAGLFCRPRRSRGAAPAPPPAPVSCPSFGHTDPVSCTVTTSYYDAQGRLTGVYDPASTATTYTYYVGDTNEPVDRLPPTAPPGTDPEEEDPAGPRA